MAFAERKPATIQAQRWIQPNWNRLHTKNRPENCSTILIPFFSLSRSVFCWNCFDDFKSNCHSCRCLANYSPFKTVQSAHSAMFAGICICGCVGAFLLFFSFHRRRRQAIFCSPIHFLLLLLLNLYIAMWTYFCCNGRINFGNLAKFGM